MTKKVVISANSSWNVFNFRLALIENIKEKGFEVLIIAPEDEWSDKLKNIGCKYYPINIKNRGVNPISDILLSIRYLLILLRVRPDYYLGFTVKPNIYGGFAASFLGIRVVNNISGLGSALIKGGWLGGVVKILYKFSLNKSYRVFFQNLDDYSLFVNSKLVAANKSDILPGSGIDLDNFQYTPKNPGDDGPFKFLLIGRIIKDKGILEYFEAAKILKSKYKNVEFILVGFLNSDNPSALNPVELKRWEEQGYIKYLGHTNDVRPLIKTSDCVVLPSYREGTSRVLLETAAIGRPIVTTDVPGCKEVVDDSENGFLCRPGDPIDLSDKMEMMIKLNHDERNIMGSKGRSKVEKEFDQNIVFKKYIDVLLSS